MKPEKILLAGATKSIPITAVAKPAWPAFAAGLPAQQKQWSAAHDFNAEAGRPLILPDGQGRVGQVLFGLGEAGKTKDSFTFGKLARTLPAGVYRLEGDLPDKRLAVLGWLLEAYDYDRYKKAEAKIAQLVCPDDVDRAWALRSANAAWLTRDLVNTPSSDMGPEELEKAARAVASSGKAKLKVISGKALERDFPMVHAVGKASTRPPRLIDFTWGAARAPKVTLVGKGVCFDTGGLDIKPSSNMLLMKKDMGGAANVLALAYSIMAAKLPVRLRVLIPAVENAISGNAFRPGDILKSRKGLTVEIGNTDAEGRLILADALALADEEEPDLLIDMATLTGAARVALGPDLPPFYTDDDEAAQRLFTHAMAENDPLWRMPLWDAYYSMIEPKIADLSNSGESPFAGSVTAALFLKRFVEKAKTYIHFDIFAWTPAAKPGRPKGGEAQGIRALFELIRERYADQA